MSAWCLFVTVLFANFAESVAEGRGKAQAASLKKTQKDTTAHLLGSDGSTTDIRSSELKKNDVVLVSAGEIIPGDGEVIEGVASVDESAITGESAPVVRESGGDFCSVTGGTTVVSDWLKIRITSDPGNSFLDRMIALVEGASRKKTPNEIALNTLLVSLTIIFLIVIVTLYPMAVYSGVQLQISTLIALAVCLIPTTIGGLLSAIGIAGMDRVTRFNVIAMSGKAVEACGDVDTMILDKTGTITYGNRLAADFFPVDGADRSELIRCAALTCLHDDDARRKIHAGAWHAVWVTTARRTTRFQLYRVYRTNPYERCGSPRWNQNPKRCGRCNREVCQRTGRKYSREFARAEVE